MHSKANTVKLLTSLGLSMMLLHGCALAPVGTRISCPPPLPPVPESTLDVLIQDARDNDETATFIVDLDRQYQYQDVCGKSVSK